MNQSEMNRLIESSQEHITQEPSMNRIHKLYYCNQVQAQTAFALIIRTHPLAYLCEEGTAIVVSFLTSGDLSADQQEACTEFVSPVEARWNGAYPCVVTGTAILVEDV